jgi:imidazolonepropionase-like amidohydrolase
LWRSFVVLLLAGPIVSCQTFATRDAPADLVIANVTVIDPETRRVLPDRSVFVRGERILAVVPSRPGRNRIAVKVIDGTGRFLIPGLIDMHVHLFLPEATAPTLNLLLANGVTSIREMSSDCWAAAGATDGCVEDYRRLRSRIAAGEVAGPDLVAITSAMVMGPTRLKLPEGLPSFITPVTDVDGRALVQYFGTRGVDLIKTHDSIPSAAFRALMDEAARRGMKVGGHVPFEAGSLGAAQLGYRSIEHARDLLYDCSRYGPEYRRREAAFANGETGAVRPTSLERLERTVSEYDAGRCAALLRSLAATGVYYTPTHVTREMEALADDPDYRAEATRRYVPTERNARWEADLKETSALPAEEREALRNFFRHGLTITSLAHRAGIPIMAGTDANDTMIVPGYSLHRELQHLSQAGLSNMDVLRAATSVPARYLGRTADLGGIAAGKQADLVLLRSNPLEDLSNTTAVEQVIANGRVITRDRLDALLREVEARTK